MVAAKLESYMDESGTHDTAHACVIAGYWGAENRWRTFERRWKGILRDANEPSLKEFHSVDFWKPDGTRRGVFRDWSDAKADTFIGDLLACIGESHIYPTSSSLIVAEWERLNKNERMFLTGGQFDPVNLCWATQSAPNHTYYLPFQFVVAAAALACKEHLKVHYVFDIQKQFKNHAADMFAWLQKDEKFSCRERLGKFAMANSIDAPGLQAADLLAYQTYQHAKERMLTELPTPRGQLSWILQGALKNTRHNRDHLFFDATGIEKAVKGMPACLRGIQKDFPTRIIKRK